MSWIKEKIKLYGKWVLGLLIPVAFAAPLIFPLSGECVDIQSAIANKTAIERKAIKAERVSKCFQTGEFINAKYGLRIQIQSIEKITVKGQDGIEIIARAWDASVAPEKIGFGKDGSVEWERFRIFNPPILIPDGTKRNIPRLIANEPDILADNFKEDIQEATIISLAHTISVVGKDGSKIIPGRVGNTTSTFYPDTGNPGAASVDGTIEYRGAAAYATAHDAAAGTHGDTNGTSVLYNYNAIAGGLYYVGRALTHYDTSALSGSTITSATISLYHTSKLDNNDDSTSIVGNTIVSDITYTTADFDLFGTTKFATDINNTDLTTSAYNDFALNANGITNISLTGVSHFGVRSANDIANSTPSANSDCVFSAADVAGSTQDPKLVVETLSAAEGETDDFINIIPIF